MKAFARVEEEFGSAPGPEHQRELGTGDRIAVLSRVFCEPRIHIKIEVVRAQANGRANTFAPTTIDAAIQTIARLANRIFAHGLEAFACDRAIQADLADVVVTDLHAAHELLIESQPAKRRAPRPIATVNAALIDLLKLIAVLRIGEIGEVRNQVQVVIDRVQQCLRSAATELPGPIGGQAVTMRTATVRRVDGTEPINQPGLHRPLRNLIRRAPVAFVTLSGDAEQTIRRFAAVTEQTITL